MGKPTSLKESDIQIQVADWLRLFEASCGFIFMSIPNEGKDRRNIARLMKLIRMGMRPGAGDILIIKAGRAHFLEMKKLGERQSEDQILFEGEARLAGAEYAVAHTFVAAQKIIRGWRII
jgi:hypothetical protein